MSGSAKTRVHRELAVKHYQIWCAIISGFVVVASDDDILDQWCPKFLSLRTGPRVIILPLPTTGKGNYCFKFTLCLTYDYANACNDAAK